MLRCCWKLVGERRRRWLLPRESNPALKLAMLREPHFSGFDRGLSVRVLNNIAGELLIFAANTVLACEIARNDFRSRSNERIFAGAPSGYLDTVQCR